MSTRSGGAGRRDAAAKRAFNELLEANIDESAVGVSVVTDIETVSNSTSRGLRETVLTICVGRLLDGSYDPTAELYKINPRAVYEQVLRPELVALRVPAGKSGILNVAKAAQGLTTEWASQRRGNAAEAVVRLAKLVATGDREEVLQIGSILVDRMQREAIAVAELAVEVSDDSSPESVAGAFIKMYQSEPAGGNTLQRTVGLIYLQMLDSLEARAHADGLLDSASTTNTTSNKPGDLVLLSSRELPLQIAEITGKKFDAQRISESVEAVRDYLRDQEVPPVVTVLCREQDVPTDLTGRGLGYGLMGSVVVDGVRFDFVDVNMWIAIQISNLPETGRQHLMGNFNNYVDEPNTPVPVKALWKEINS